MIPIVKLLDYEIKLYMINVLETDGQRHEI